jgi:hypothetical protein
MDCHAVLAVILLGPNHPLYPAPERCRVVSSCASSVELGNETALWVLGSVSILIRVVCRMSASLLARHNKLAEAAVITKNFRRSSRFVRLADLRKWLALD